jgi:hypothetical protein
MNFTVSRIGAGNKMTSTTKYRKIDRNGTIRRMGRFFLNATKRLTPAISRMMIKGIIVDLPPLFNLGG